MKIREIQDGDLDRVLTLLLEGFGVRGEAYWRRGLTILKGREPVEPFPRFGYVIEADGDCQGVILLISSKDDGGNIRSNLSSWYVRPSHRQYATFLYRHALKAKGSTFLNLSPALHVTPIIETLGFRPYTAGVLLLDLRQVVSPSLKGVRLRAFTADSGKLLSDSDRQRASRHMSYGCSGVVVEQEQASRLILYRTRRLKDWLPCAQILYGDLTLVRKVAGPLLRHLLKRGVPFALLDATTEDVPAWGERLYPGQHLRYYKGGPVPATGDLCDTELAVLGP